MNGIYLLLDLDNTVWDKRQLDSKAFEAVSTEVFNRQISMLTHPVTGAADKQFHDHSQREIWQYKIAQILAEGEALALRTDHGMRSIKRVQDVDLDDLVARLGPAGLQCYEDGGSSLVHNYLSPCELRDLIREIRPAAVAACSLGARELQDRVLRDAGFYDAGISRELSTFGEEAQSKKALVQRAVDKYRTNNQDPLAVLLIDDSPRATTAIRELAQESYSGCTYQAVGIGSQELHSGAALVIDTLASPVSVGRLASFLRSLR